MPRIIRRTVQTITTVTWTVEGEDPSANPLQLNAPADAGVPPARSASQPLTESSPPTPTGAEPTGENS